MTSVVAWWCFALVWTTSGVGIKRRLAEAKEAEAQAAQEAVGDDPCVASNTPSSSSGARPRGGVRQRLQRAKGIEASEDTPPQPQPQGPLWQGLVRRWALGKISAGDLQRQAAEAVGQGASGMDEMASIANFGENPQNCYRALKQLLGLPKGAPPFEWAKIPTSSGDRWHPFLMPHEFFHRYYLGQQGKWAGTITGPANAALQFWRSMAKTDFMRLHPSLPQAHWATTVPFGPAWRWRELLEARLHLCLLLEFIIRQRYHCAKAICGNYNPQGRHGARHN